MCGDDSNCIGSGPLKTLSEISMFVREGTFDAEIWPRNRLPCTCRIRNKGKEKMAGGRVPDISLFATIRTVRLFGV